MKLRRLFIVLFFATLAFVHTWPLVINLATLSRNNNADTELNEWIISWIAHALASDPANLFNANIFYPEPRTIAFSEPLIVPALFGAPLLWLGASPVLAYNVLVLLGMLSMALAMYFAVVSFTNDRLAGLLSGTLFVFSSQYLTRVCHLQALFSAPLPLALWALDRLLECRRVRYAFLLGLFIACSAYTSGYLCVMVGLLVMVGVIVRWNEWTARNARSSCLPCLALAAIIALVLVFPISLVYWRVYQEQGLYRSLEDCIPATPFSYLISDGSLYHYFGLSPTDPFPPLFPGVTAVFFALVGLAGFQRHSSARRARIRMLVSVAVLGFVLSLGTATPVYEWFYRAFLPFHGLRAVCRFGYLVGFVCATLAGLGLSDLRHRLGSQGWYVGIAICAILAANIEGLHALNAKYVPFKGIPAIYNDIGKDSKAVVVELPIPPVAYLNGAYMLNSTAHWRPLLNGYSGFIPRSYELSFPILRKFPAPEALALLRERGVTHVVLNSRKYAPDKFASIIDILSRQPDFQFLSEDNENGIRIYRRGPENQESGEKTIP